MFLILIPPLRKKCPYSKLFWFAFFPFFLAFGLNTERYFVFSRNAGKCRKNADQNNSKYGHFLLNVILYAEIAFNLLTPTSIIHTSNFEVDGYSSKEDLFGQISLSMNAMYVFLPKVVYKFRNDYWVWN